MGLCIDLHPRMYTSGLMSDREITRCIRLLRRKPSDCDVYLIVPAYNEKDMLDIFSCKELTRPFYQGKKHLLLGLAGSYNDALSLVEQMAADCMATRGDCNLREYFM